VPAFPAAEVTEGRWYVQVCGERCPRPVAQPGRSAEGVPFRMIL
jgi:hypothetical protein